MCMRKENYLEKKIARLETIKTIIDEKIEKNQLKLEQVRLEREAKEAERASKRKPTKVKKEKASKKEDKKVDKVEKVNKKRNKKNKEVVIEEPVVEVVETPEVVNEKTGHKRRSSIK